MQLAMKQDSPMFSSDGGAWAIVKESDAPGISHPRSLAIQARVLSTSVREQKVLAVENAIIIMTPLPTRFLRMEDRGLLLSGYIGTLQPKLLTPRVKGRGESAK